MIIQKLPVLGTIFEVATPDVLFCFWQWLKLSILGVNTRYSLLYNKYEFYIQLIIICLPFLFKPYLNIIIKNIN